MNKVEVKARVDFRMKPLLLKGVRILYKNAEFSITDYDYYDSTKSFLIYASDRKDPLEFTLDTIQTFLNTIKRKDGIPVPKFNEDGTVLHSKSRKRKAVAAGTDDDEEEEEQLPEEINDSEETEEPAKPTPPP